MEAALSRGLYLGLNGIMTFTKDSAQLEAVKQIPLNKLMLETDAPFLTPEPFRGSICEPKHILNIAEFLADLRNETVEQISEVTTNNATELFKLND
jgi:TatD DNase family protein